MSLDAARLGFYVTSSNQVGGANAKCIGFRPQRDNYFLARSPAVARLFDIATIVRYLSHRKSNEEIGSVQWHRERSSS
jgi:hypothetical protein